MSNIPELRFKEFSGEWEEKQIKNILKIGSGKDYKHLQNGDIPVYGTGGYMLSVNDFLYDGESICIGRKGTIDKPIFLNGKFWTVDTLFYTHSFQNSIPSFIYLIFQKINWKKYNEASGVPSLSKNTIEKIKIKLPQKPEQQKIASFLTTVDTKIEQLTKKVEFQEQYKKGVMQKIFSGEIRFKKDNGSDFPKWEETALKTILKERKTYSTKGQEYTHISLTKKGVVPKSERYERDFLVGDDSVKKYKITYLDDICYNPANLKFGVICRNKFGSGIFSPIYITFEVIDAYTPFVEYLVTRQDFINKVRKYEEGTVYERQAVKPSDFLKFSPLIPCFDEQVKIASFILTLEKQIDLGIKQLEKIKEFKKGLLQRMFV